MIDAPSPAADIAAKYSCIDIDHSHWHRHARTALDNHAEHLFLAQAALSTYQGFAPEQIPSKDLNQPWPQQGESCDLQVGSSLLSGTGESTKGPLGTPVVMSEAATGTPYIPPYATGTACTPTSAFIKDFEQRAIRSNVQCGPTSRDTGKIYDDPSEILDTALTSL
ncbi:hypothetical protein Q7P35_006608 [Cladosporium inversicolor]